LRKGDGPRQAQSRRQASDDSLIDTPLAGPTSNFRAVSQHLLRLSAVSEFADIETCRLVVDVKPAHLVVDGNVD
jgi:hypothetical protein